MDILLSMSGETSVFGEVTVHFRSGPPLLLPVSHAMRERLLHDARAGRPFCLISSLDNRALALRIASVSDLFFSSAGADESGPEVERYEPGPGIYPEDAFWQTVEHLYSGELADLGEAEKGVMDILWPGALDYRASMQDAHRPCDQHTQRFFANATETVWQCASGFRRAVWMLDDAALVRCLQRLSDWSDGSATLLHLPVDEYQEVLINPHELDYLSVPAHRARRALQA